MKRFFKRLFRQLAVLAVTAWARINYRKGVRMADARHKKEKVTVYLAAENFHPDRLRTYTKREFKTEKHVFGFHARLLTMTTLRRGCYYYTPDGYGNNAMTPREREVKRRFFIRERLQRAGLV